MESVPARFTSTRLFAELRYPPFLVLVGIGIVVRVVLTRLYYPAVMLSFDAPRYARVDMPIFGDFWMPAGYPLLLLLLRGFSHQLWVTITIQHAMGVVVGMILFLVGRRLGLSRALALIPAAVALVSGDHLYLEHQIMADSTLLFWVVIGASAAVFAFTAGRRDVALGIASTALAFGALTRSVAIFLIPLLCLGAAVYAEGSMVQRLKAVAAAALPACVVFTIYISSCRISGGQYLGLADMRGWNLYCRVAPFADCRQFTPPAGTEILCESRPQDERPGPFGYVWDLASVPRRNFALGPETGTRLGLFARQVILHQPMGYLRVVLIDLARYVEPWSTSNWAYAGQSPGILSFGWRDTGVEQVVVQALAKKYRGTKVRLYGKDALTMYQNVTRVTGFPVIVLLAASIGGIAKGKGRLRFGAVLFGAIAVVLYAIPAITYSYDFRYGVPAVTFLVAAGVCGIASISPQLRDPETLSGAEFAQPDQMRPPPESTT